MKTDVLWTELENEIRSAPQGVWLSRFALPKAGYPLLVAMERETGKRALLLPLQSSAVPPCRDWPHCAGLEFFRVSFDCQEHLGVRLLDQRYSDIFCALADDVAPHVCEASTASSALAAFMERLRRWHKFLSARALELTVSKQRGLYGELHTMRKWILPNLGVAHTIDGWRGPEAANQDFQFPGGAIEVKTSTAKQPSTVRITSERQLDGTGIRALFLHVVVLDEREVDSDAKTGETLPDIVEKIRLAIAVESDALDAFEDRLLDYGYLDADAPRYANKRYTERSEYSFEVHTEFPRLLEQDLKNGVGNVSYELALSACAAFSVAPIRMIASIKGETPLGDIHA